MGAVVIDLVGEQEQEQELQQPLEYARFPDDLRSSLCSYFLELMCEFPEFASKIQKAKFQSGTASDEDIIRVLRRLKEAEDKACIVLGLRKTTKIPKHSLTPAFNFLIPEPMRTKVEWAHESDKTWPLSEEHEKQFEAQVVAFDEANGGAASKVGVEKLREELRKVQEEKEELVRLLESSDPCEAADAEAAAAAAMAAAGLSDETDDDETEFIHKKIPRDI